MCTYTAEVGGLLGPFAEYLSEAAGSSSVHNDPDAAWIESLMLSIKGMRDASRWLLGVVVGWLLVIPQLPELRRLVPCDLPIAAIWLAAGVLLFSVAYILIAVLEVQAPAGDKSVDLHELRPIDLAYIQAWGVMSNPSNLTDWNKQREFFGELANGYKHRTPKEAQEWLNARIPGGPPAPLPSKADLKETGERWYWMRMEEFRALLILSQRDMRWRYSHAKWSILVFGLLATLSLLVLIGPASTTCI